MNKLKTFTFWIARSLADRHAYDIRCRTKREVLDELEKCNAEDYSKPKKITVEYTNTMDLINTFLSGGVNLD